jgi:hypothetical protein
MAATDFLSDSMDNAGSWRGCSPERKAKETHWHAVRQKINLTPLPLALGKGKALRVFPWRTFVNQGTAASVEACDEKAPRCFRRAGPSGPERLRVQAAVSLTLSRKSS